MARTKKRGRKAVAKRKPSNRRKPVKRKPKQQPVKQSISAFALSVSEWCAACGIGRTNFYKMLREGTGPPTVMLGGRRIITQEGSAQWLRAREAEAMEIAAQQRKAMEAPALEERTETEAA